MSDGPKVALVAGEASGDILGAGLIRAIAARHPDARFMGIAGPLMREAGCEVWHDADELAVFGLVEVIKDLPRLLRLRRATVERLLEERPDVVIGIDSPDFTLELERRVRAGGLKTVHYVSPSVWAWRAGRKHTVARAADRLLCLLPFEPEHYAGTGLEARFVGHPLADQLEPPKDRDQLRSALGVGVADRVLAVLPGSRRGEVGRLAPPIADALAHLAARDPQLRFLLPLARPGLAELVGPIREALGERLVLVRSGSRDALSAADAAIVASGTATLEAMLLGCPMVSVYRLAPVTHGIVVGLGLMKIRRFALPNLLHGGALVPEVLQDELTGPRLADATIRVLEDDRWRRRTLQRFTELAQVLRRDASERAADEVLDLIGRGGTHGTA